MRNGVALKALIGDSTTFQSYGQLNAEQGDAFIDLTVNEQVVLQECTVERITANSKELEALSLASCGLRATTLMMVFKLVKEAEKR